MIVENNYKLTFSTGRVCYAGESVIGLDLETMEVMGRHEVIGDNFTDTEREELAEFMRMKWTQWQNGDQSAP